MNEKLRAQLVRDEGRIPYAYEDSAPEKYLTIGVGHLIDKRRGGSLPDEIIDALLDHDIRKHSQELFARLPWVANLDPARQGVLINMAFNLGVNGLLGFAVTLGKIQAGDYEGAAVNMLKSKWAEQVGPRAKRLSEQMRTGVWQ